GAGELVLGDRDLRAPERVVPDHRRPGLRPSAAAVTVGRVVPGHIPRILTVDQDDRGPAAGRRDVAPAEDGVGTEQFARGRRHLPLNAVELSYPDRDLLDGLADRGVEPGGLVAVGDAV